MYILWLYDIFSGIYYVYISHIYTRNTYQLHLNKYMCPISVFFAIKNMKFSMSAVD